MRSKQANETKWKKIKKKTNLTARTAHTHRRKKRCEDNRIWNSMHTKTIIAQTLNWINCWVHKSTIRHRFYALEIMCIFETFLLLLLFLVTGICYTLSSLHDCGYTHSVSIQLGSLCCKRIAFRSTTIWCLSMSTIFRVQSIFQYVWVLMSVSSCGVMWLCECDTTQWNENDKGASSVWHKKKMKQTIQTTQQTATPANKNEIKKHNKRQEKWGFFDNWNNYAQTHYTTEWERKSTSVSV